MARLINQMTGEVLLAKVEVADTFWKRFVGLQFRHPLPSDAGLWLAPCSALHTCFMRFPIDVIMLDRENIVLGTRKNFRAWRMMSCLQGTTSVIETNVDAIRVAAGTRVVLAEVLF